MLHKFWAFSSFDRLFSFQLQCGNSFAQALRKKCTEKNVRSLIELSGTSTSNGLLSGRLRTISRILKADKDVGVLILEL